MTPVRAITIALVLIVAAATPVAAQEPDPAEGARIVRSALDALEPLPSYRFEVTRSSSITPGVETVIRTVRVNEPAFALHTQMLMDDEVGADLQVVGEEGTISWFGGPHRSMETLGRTAPDSDSGEANVETDLLARLAEEGALLELVGPTTLDGVPVLHHAGTTLPDPPRPGSESASRWTMDGTIELWVHADDGYLVASEVDVIRVGGFFGTGTRPSRLVERVRVSGVGDPANIVTLPAVTEPPPLATGDPSLAPMIRWAYRGALRDLRSWRSTMRALQLGMLFEQELVVVPAGGRVRSQTVSNGDLFLDYVIRGKRMWVRDGEEGPWAQRPRAKRPSCDGEPCTFQNTVRLRPPMGPIIETFTTVGDEAIDGIPAVHLRSVAGMQLPQIGWIPGTWDLWIATDGGHLIRETFDGSAMATEQRITHVNDPSNQGEVAVPKQEIATSPTEP
jgi:hypothetical protein